MSLVLIMVDISSNILCEPVLKKLHGFGPQFLAIILIIAGFNFQISLESEIEKYIFSREINHEH